MKKILIAEDSSVIQNLVKKVLSQTSDHYVFTTVKNGELLLKAIEEDTFDLFLVDINIPKVDGISCASQIRKNKNHKSKPIIAITGNANNYSSEEFTTFGFNDFLIKPLNFDALVQKVQEYMD